MKQKSVDFNKLLYNSKSSVSSYAKGFSTYKNAVEAYKQLIKMGGAYVDDIDLMEVIETRNTKFDKLGLEYKVKYIVHNFTD